MNDSGSVCLITQDEAWRRGSTVPLKRNVDEALTKPETIRTGVVVRRTGNDVPMQEGRDHWYHELVAGQDATCEPEAMDSEDLLFTLYTSGTKWITFTPELPKTRSGKIMRRLLRDISETASSATPPRWTTSTSSTSCRAGPRRRPTRNRNYWTWSILASTQS
jgi:acyl-coenzyme A synthetase/AMP-(fatty) acid ligase